MRSRVVAAAALGFCVGLAAVPSSAEKMRASFYWEGKRTANGEKFVPLGLTAAHRTLPFGTRLHVRFGGRSVEVRVNDRGPFVAGRSLDLSLGAARALGMEGVGVATVEVERE